MVQPAIAVLSSHEPAGPAQQADHLQQGCAMVNGTSPWHRLATWVTREWRDLGLGAVGEGVSKGSGRIRAMPMLLNECEAQGTIWNTWMMVSRAEKGEQVEGLGGRSDLLSTMLLGSSSARFAKTRMVDRVDVLQKRHLRDLHSTGRWSWKGSNLNH